MTKVRILVRPSGLINGVDWPAVDEVMDLDDAVAEGMAAAGVVEVVKDKPKTPAKKQAAAKVETRPAPTKGVEKR